MERGPLKEAEPRRGVSIEWLWGDVSACDGSSFPVSSDGVRALRVHVRVDVAGMRDGERGARLDAVHVRGVGRG